jgi:membrane-associated protease RseP (regulator of RpoE activity)
MPWKVLLRDLALLGVCLGLLAWDASLREAGRSGALGTAVALGAGLLLGLVGYLLHEWGHLAGARLSGSVVTLPRSARTIFTFFYDTQRNTREQFLAMSCGGFVASAAMVTLYVSVLPLGALSGRVALAVTALGVVATVALELPTAWRVYRGAGLPAAGPAYVSARSPGR